MGCDQQNGCDEQQGKRKIQPLTIIVFLIFIIIAVVTALDK